MRALLTAAFVCWLGTGGPAHAQPDQVHLVPAFDFENGAGLDCMKVGYSTYGALNADRSNAVLVTHGTSQNRDVYKPFIGAGKAFDTDRYFVIAVDGIGGGLSSQPSDGLGPGFPRYTVRDMVRAQHDLVTKRSSTRWTPRSGWTPSTMAAGTP